MRYIAIHAISKALGPIKSEALRGFHAFTGSDSTSYFAGCGKPTSWKVWLAHDDVSAAFVAIGSPLQSLPDVVFAALERYTVLLFDIKSDKMKVDAARKDLSVSGGRSLFTIPPTEAALRQHALRAVYQAGHIWGKALDEIPDPAPAPTSWGWKLEDGRLSPHWTTLTHLWAACRSLDKCGCKSGCETQRCKCRSSNLPCIVACTGCKGKCSNSRCCHYLRNVVERQKAFLTQVFFLFSLAKNNQKSQRKKMPC